MNNCCVCCTGVLCRDMCCSANPDAPAEPAPLPRSRSGAPLHGRPAGASSDRDRRDPTHEQGSHVGCGAHGAVMKQIRNSSILNPIVNRDVSRSHLVAQHTDTATRRRAPRRRVPPGPRDGDGTMVA